MKKLKELLRVQAADFRGVASSDEDSVTLQMAGSADHESMALVGQLVEGAQAEAKRMNPREAGIDIRKLEFMNSSSLKVFVSWIAELHESPEVTYNLRFRSKPSAHWPNR